MSDSSVPPAASTGGSAGATPSSTAPAPAPAKISYAARAAAAAAAPAPAAAAAPVASAPAVRTKKSVPKLPSHASRKREMWALFEAAAREILDKWDLLRTAVIEEWGGRSSRSKYDTIVDDLLMNVEEQWKAGHDLHLDTLDVYLLECLDADFNIDFEDDNVVTEVSTLLQDVYRKCALGEEAAVQEIMSSLHTHNITKKSKVDRPKAEGDDDDDDEDDDDEDGEFDEEDDEDDDEEGEGGAAAGAGRREDKKSSKKAAEVDEDGWATIPTTAAGKKAGKGGKGAADASEGGAGGSGSAGAGSAAAPTSAFAALAVDDDASSESSPPEAN